MRNILKRKPVIIGLIALAVVALVVPVAFVSAAPSNPTSRPGSNITTVQGVISSITSTEIVIKTTASDGTPSQLSLAIDGNTNFNIHGIDWLSGSLNGKTVSAIYKNNQTVTPPVASQITINMPKPTAPAASALKKGEMVQGTIASINSNTMTITLNATGAGTLAANQKVVIVPSPVQSTPNKNIAREQGTVVTISGNTVTVTLTGTGTVTFTVGQTVSIGQGMTPGVARPQNNNNGRFGGFPSRF